MTPGYFLDVLDDHLARTPPGWFKARRHVLELTAATVLLTEPVPREWHGHQRPDPKRGVCYGYTVTQCHQMREHLLAAARQDGAL